jgi:hypothetical protein
MTPSTRPPSAPGDLARLARTGRTIQALVWLDAAAVVVTSAGTIFTLVRHHGASVMVAVPYSAAIDIALLAGLLGDRALARHSKQVFWGVVLRWATGLMSLALNTAQALAEGDTGGAAIHAVPPVLLILLTEAAAAYAVAFAELSTATATVPALAPVPGRIASTPRPSTDDQVSRRPVPDGRSAASPARPSVDDHVRRPSATAAPSTDDQRAGRTGRPVDDAPALRTVGRPSAPVELTERQRELLEPIRPFARALAQDGKSITRDNLGALLRGNDISVPNADLGPIAKVLAREPLPTPREVTA